MPIRFSNNTNGKGDRARTALAEHLLRHKNTSASSARDSQGRAPRFSTQKVKSTKKVPKVASRTHCHLHYDHHDHHCNNGKKTQKTRQTRGSAARKAAGAHDTTRQKRDRNATEMAPNNEPATRSSPLQHQSRPPFLIMRLLTQRRAHWIDLKTKRVDKQSTDNVFD